MLVFITQLRAITGSLYGGRWWYKFSAHLWSKDSKTLEKFARRLGLKPEWKHEDHYDVASKKYDLAIRLGAIEITDRQLVRMRRLLKQCPNE